MIVAQPMAATQTFLCLECGTKVDTPEGKHGFLRCSQGHRVQVLKSRPLWQIGLLAFWIAFVILGAPANVLQGSWISWLVLGAAAIWSAYVIVRGIQLLSRPEPINRIGRQYVVVGIARVLAAAIVGWYVWGMLQRGYWPISN
jgi:hypothetical protein